MIELFCRDTHAPAGGGLCSDCEQLYQYAMGRIDRCPYEDEKPTCARCPVHCYKPERRSQVRQVMRYAGPRMLRSHPLLTILHYLDDLTGPSAESLDASPRNRRRRSRADLSQDS
jgi:hypothetical protein